MTGEQIKSAVERYVNEVIDKIDAIEGINQALGWLQDKAGLIDEVQIQAVAGTWYNLPDDCIGVLSVQGTNGTAKYDKQDNSLLFYSDDTYTVRYRKIPFEIVSLTTEIPIHKAFHRVLVTGFAAWWKLREEENNADGLRLLAKFERDAAYTASLLRRKYGPAEVQVIR